MSLALCLVPQVHISLLSSSWTYVVWHLMDGTGGDAPGNARAASVLCCHCTAGDHYGEGVPGASGWMSGWPGLWRSANIVVLRAERELRAVARGEADGEVAEAVATRAMAKSWGVDGSKGGSSPAEAIQPMQHDELLHASKACTPPPPHKSERSTAGALANNPSSAAPPPAAPRDAASAAASLSDYSVVVVQPPPHRAQIRDHGDEILAVWTAHGIL